MTPIIRKPRIWFYNGYWRCNARPWDVIGKGDTPSRAYLQWMHLWINEAALRDLRALTRPANRARGR